MTIRFSCPECGANLAVPDNLAGRTGKCKKCNADVTAPKSSPSTANARQTLTKPIGDLKANRPDDRPRVELQTPVLDCSFLADDEGPGTGEKAAHRTCPYCDGEISETAKKCKSCREWIERPAVPALPNGSAPFAPPPTRETGGTVNYLMVFLGVLFMVVGFFVANYFLYTFEICHPDSNIINAGLVNARTNGVIIGAAFFVSGVIMFAVGAKR